MDIRVPLFRDVNTPEFNMTGESSNYLFPPGYRQEATTEITMDCMAFGMGMCCLVSAMLLCICLLLIAITVAKIGY